MDKIIKAGIVGFLITVVIDLFSPVDLLFVPPFVASIIAIYSFDLKEVKHAVLVAFVIYIFSDWIWGSIGVLALLASGESITYTVDYWIAVNQLFSPITALLAGLVGAGLVEKKQRATTLPRLPSHVPVPPPPPSPAVPVAQQQEKKFCRHCGAENKTDAIFCERCGKKIG